MANGEEDGKADAANYFMWEKISGGICTRSSRERESAGDVLSPIQSRNPARQQRQRVDEAVKRFSRRS